MMSPVSSIRNLGPSSEAAFREAGITSAEQLREMGADAAYGKLLRSGTRPHFIGFYALVMGLQGRPWNDCTAEEKVHLRARFDRLRAEFGTNSTSQLEVALDALGLPSPGVRRR